MKRFFSLLLLLATALSMNAQLLWKISGQGLPQPSYLFGTHHTAPVSVKDSVAGLDEAWKTTQQVYGEIVLAELQSPAMQARMQEKALMPKGQKLSDLFTPAQRDSINPWIQKKIGADLSAFNAMKPCVLTNLLTILMNEEAVRGFDPMKSIDGSFQEEAKKAGKKVGALETAEMQMHLLYESQSLKRQAQELYCLVTHLDHNKKMARRMTDAYMLQDLDELQELLEMKMENDCDSTPEEEAALLYNRNADWAKKMPAIMKQASTLFVVGVGHLPGERGVLNLLRQAGYDVEEVE